MFLQTGKKALCFVTLTFLLVGMFDVSGIHTVSAESAAVVNTSDLAGKAAQIYAKYYGNLSIKQKSALDGVIKKIEGKYQKDPVGYISSAYLSLASNKADPDSQVAFAAWGVKKQPDSVTLLNNLGVALSFVKNHKDAIVILEAAQLTQSDSLEAITNLGNAYLDSDRDKEAKAQYEKALKIDKNHTAAWEGLYAYYMKKKDFKSAMNILSKIAPVGFVKGGVNKMQQELEKEPESKKLEAVKKTDSIESGNQKIMKMVEKKPLTLAPVVETISPQMAAKIRAEMGSLKAKVAVPAKPFLYSYSNLEQYYIYQSAYSGRTATSSSANTMYLDPATLDLAKKLEGMSEAEIQAMADEYVKGIQDTMSKYGDLKGSDPAELMKAVKDLKLATGKDMFAKLQPKGSTAKTLQQLGVQEKKGVITSSNYSNYTRHKSDYQTHLQNLIKKFEEDREKMRVRFEEEMSDLTDKQTKQGEAAAKQYVTQRNQLRKKYLNEFGSFLTAFYSKNVQPLIEKVENSQALYIKNMGSKQLKKMEGEQLKLELNAFMEYFAKAEAPIDSYEVYENQARKQLDKKIEEIKKQAEKKDEPLPPLKEYEKTQKTLLEKIYEDTKFEATCGLAKVTYENAEITLSLSNPLNNEYMDIGASLKDLSVSLTEGEGIEVGFKVAQKGGGKNDAIQAEIGYSNKGVGKKTTLFFDDSFNVADATQTTVPGSSGFSSQVSVFDAGVEGSVKIETTAEGSSTFVSGIKASYKDLQLYEKQYKEPIAQP